MATQDVKIRITALDKTSGALRNIGGALGKLTKPILNMRTALGGLIGAGGMTLLVRQSLNATDALAKTAGRIGTTSEALSALQYAGDLTGVSVNTMNMALQRFTRRTAEAAVGTGEAKGAIRELGIDARELVRLPLDQRMLVLADAFEGVQNESDRLRLAFKLFDSEGAALVNTLSQGRDGLAEMLGEAEALGLVMTSDAAKGVEDANDAMTRMFGVSKGLVNQFVAALAPAIEIAANSLTEFSKSMLTSEGGARAFAINAAASFLEFAAASINNFERLANGGILAINAIIGAANGLAPVFAGINFLFDAVVQGIKSQINTIISFTQLIDQALVKLGQKPIFSLEQFQLQPLEFVIEQFDKIDRVDFSGTVNALNGVAEVVRQTGEAAVTAGEAMEELAPSPTAFEGFMQNLEQSRSQVESFQDAAVKLATSIEGKFTQAFTDAITGAKDFGDAMKGLAKSVVDSLIKMLVQYYITKPLFDAITGGFSSAAGGAGGAGGGGGATGMSFNGGGFTGYGARAGGVDGKGGFPAILHPNETVLDHTKGQGQGVTIVQNINVTTGVQQTVRAEIANLLPQISNAAKAAVADSRMRGGGFSKAMVGA